MAARMRRLRGERLMMRGRWAIALFFAAILVFIAWQGRKMMEIPLPRTLVLYCFSGMADAMEEGILPAFREHWKKETGEELEFVTTYAGSGVITNRILRRLPAEIAIFSSDMDRHRVLEGGLLGPGWKNLPHNGIVARSPVLILTRSGNPREIAGFEDLARPGTRVVHPDPRTSGAGEWAVLAVYGSSVLAGQDAARAGSLLTDVWNNVVERPTSARHADAAFESGAGDALVTYEAEWIRSVGLGRSWHAVYPELTAMTEPVVVKIERNVPKDQERVVEALLRFLWTEEAQASLVRFGFRSVIEELNVREERFQSLRKVFTLADMGGQRPARKDIIESLWYGKIVPGLPGPRNVD